MHPIADSDLLTVDLGDNPSSRCVIESVRLTKMNTHLRCLAQNRLCDRMLGLGLRNRCSFEQGFRGDARSGTNLHDLGCSVSQSPCFVEENRVDISKFFEV